MKDGNELVAGCYYRVVIEDCCVSGNFVAKYVAKEKHNLVFDNGFVLEAWNACHFTEVESTATGYSEDSS